ncbi:nuclear transport factor 2 family protein [Neobacillus muris]|uniref:nuclear transport factor 2 family protein n=1 Tax=Neobacillus muris TaxID=2941334 RepID=UPI00203E669E|nr:nuclear transport factor 2 family protein [Neobacillus muris]
MKKLPIFITMGMILLFFGTTAMASTKDDVTTSVEKFLKAQKNCNAEMMAEHSVYFHKIDNLKEMYTRFCHENPLQQASITKLSVINEEAALVSIQSNYKEMINIRTTPVIKKDGNWKIVIGVPPSGAKSTNPENRAGEDAEVTQLFKDYVDAIKTDDLEKMTNFIKILPDADRKKIEAHLKGLSMQPAPQMITYGIKHISDSLAIVQVEIKYPNLSFTQNLAVTKENAQWKLVFGHPLTNSFIPKTGNPIMIK